MISVGLLHTILLSILSVVCFATTSCTDKHRTPSRYLIPDGYVGWVRINYNIQDAPAIPIKDGYYLFKFPQTGLINTSSEGEKGWAQDEYYYYSEHEWQRLPHITDKGMIWGQISYGSDTISGQEPTKYSEFFVGTEEQYQKYGIANKDNNLNPIIGPIIQEQKPSLDLRRPSSNTLR
jgi:hypothetical protein